MAIKDAKVVDESTITLAMPAAAKPIKVDISVTNPGEPRALAKRAFTYTAAAEPEPTPTPTAQPTTRRCRAAARSRPAAITGEAGTDLVLDAVRPVPVVHGRLRRPAP